MPTKQTEGPPAGTTTERPDWTRAREILVRINAHVRLSVAGQILLGRELKEIKEQLGFTRGGDRRSKSHAESLKEGRSWHGWCERELGISGRSGDRLISSYHAAKLKARKWGDHDLRRLLDAAPGDLDAHDEKLLEKLVDKRDWPTQRELLDDLRMARRHSSPAGGDTSEHRGKDGRATSIGEEAAGFFGRFLRKLQSEFGFRDGLARRFKCPELALIAELPLTAKEKDQVGLMELKDDLGRLVRDEFEPLLKQIEEQIRLKTES